MRPPTRPSGGQRPSQHCSPHNDDSDADPTFNSPELDDATDYGLEFTSSRLNTPRRSTLRATQATVERRPTRNRTHIVDEEVENQPPTTRAQAESSRQTQHRRARRRKQNTPLHRQRRMQLEIMKLQLSPHFMMPRLPFSRVVREVMINQTTDRTYITKSAMEALQTASEMFLTQRFQDAYLLTMHRGRVTLEVRDMALASYFCKMRGSV